MSASTCQRRRRGLTASVLAGLLALGGLIAPAQATLNDGFFALDGNTADPNGQTPPDDWNSFFPPATSNTTRATGIVPDSNPAVFRNGSKDTQDVSAWRFDLGSSPPKDNMLNAYAAAYTATAATATTSVGDLLIYFGADRDSFTGTASLGFWFFKNPVIRDDANGRFINPNTGQPATHANGDTLVAFEYTNGGAVTEVKVYRWNNGALVDAGSIGVSQTNVASVFCDSNDRICGSTNAGPLTLPWNGSIAAGQFFEGGVNITKLFPTGGDSCFAAFMATSRTSDTANASIKNFILSSFPVCKLTVTKQCESAVYRASSGDILNTVVGRILNDGGGLLTNVSLSDNPAFSATPSFYTCNADGTPTTTPKSTASLVAGDSICYRGTHVSSTLVTSDTVTASATGGNTTVTGTASAECTAPPPGPGLLELSKTCDVDFVVESSKLVVRVNYSGQVTNNGATELTNVQVCEIAKENILPADANTDPCDLNPTTYAGKLVIHSIGTLAPGAGSAYSGSYYPSTALTGSGLSTLTDPELSVFKDKVGAKGNRIPILGGVSKAIPTEATCPLCIPH